MRKRRTRDIVIELTSLLDIVMILIFAVMIENSKLVKESEAKLDTATKQIEQMTEDEKKTAEEYEAALSEKDTEIAGALESLSVKEGELTAAKDEIALKETEISDAKEYISQKETELTAAEDTITALEQEKDDISEELKIALRKLSEGEVEELIAKIKNAELKNAGYEYMDSLVVVYNVGIESIYESDTDDVPLYRTLKMSRSGTTDEDVFYEFNDSTARSIAIDEMKVKLVAGIDNVIADAAEDVNIYIILTYYSNDRTLYVDRLRVNEALVEITGKYAGEVSYRINVLNE